MNITYSPFFRDSVFTDISIKQPVVDVIGYQPKYNISTATEEDDNEDIVEEPVIESNVSEEPEIERPEQKTEITTNIKFRSKKEFKDTMTPIYENILIQKGLNPAFAKALVAQDGLESGWGKSAQGKFNYGNITLGSNKTRSYTEGRDTDGKGNPITQKFVNYNSLEDYAEAKINLLNNRRYNAFSGSLDEFADRVARGGYATDPKYAKKLKDVIQSAKYGGILKFQEGGVNEAREWVKNWYKNRAPQLKNNYRNMFTPLQVPIDKIIWKLDHNIATTNAEINPTMLENDVNGVYIPPPIRQIYLRDDNPSTAVHEWTHSSIPKGQTKEIKKIKDIFGDNMYFDSQVQPSEYLDDEAEIYAREMSFRRWAEKELGVGPDHNWTPEEVEALQNKYINYSILHKNNKVTEFNKDGKVTYNLNMSRSITDNPKLFIKLNVPEEARHFLDRYDHRFLVRILNDVAFEPSINKESPNDPLYAKLGLKIPKYQKAGVLKSKYEDPKHYYDYSAGVYNSKTKHWSSRDPKTGVVLKNPNHPTFYKGILEDEKLGYELYYDARTNRYYTLKPNELATASNMAFLKKVSDSERRELLGRRHLDTWTNRSDFSKVVPGFTKEILQERKNPYISTILETAEKNDINPEILDALFTQESRYDKDATSDAGAQGIGQLMPVNTKDIDPYNPYENIPRSAEVLSRFRDKNAGNMKRAIAGYHGYTKPENAKKKMEREDSLEQKTKKRSDNYYEVLYDLIDSLERYSTVNYPFKK